MDATATGAPAPPGRFQPPQPGFEGVGVGRGLGGSGVGLQGFVPGLEFLDGSDEHGVGWA